MSFIEMIFGFITNNWQLVAVFFTYVLLVVLLDRQGTLSKYNITVFYLLFIPVLMIRTQRGQKFLDRIAIHKRFWRMFANIGLPAMLIGMIVMFLLLIFIDYVMIQSFQTQTVPSPGKYNEARNMFLIPGINEYIPLWWGIIALAITLVVHEFSHAILCKVEGIKVKSMGILVALLPIGGFAEPDEEQLLGKKQEPDKAIQGAENKNQGSEIEIQEQNVPKKLATRSERVRVLTAGVMANFVTALIAFTLFFSLLGSISPVGEVMVTGVVPGSPADLAGVRTNMILTGINDNQINNGSEFLSYASGLKTGTNITLQLIDNKVRRSISIVTMGGNQTSFGVRIFNVLPGSPAEAAGLKPDMILTRLDNTEIMGLENFSMFMNSTTPGQKIRVEVLSNNSLNASALVFENLELAKHPDNNDIQKGFMGVTYSSEGGAISYSIGIGIGQFHAKGFLGMLQSIPSYMNGVTGWILLFGLPIYGFAGEGFPGFSGLITNFYEPVGLIAFMGDGIFWILNILLWVGWMNFYVGLFNCLPALPLDGGHVFRDVVATSLSRLFGNGEKIERISNAIAVMLAILILGSLVLVTFAPYAAHGF
ncbi:MAG: site-2 protease family protein [Candidatus Methanoperedens sp.]|nr:site-2 protease family protein [Candidatus Methanoperedens sp.]